jgi:hypothetical protein
VRQPSSPQVKTSVNDTESENRRVPRTWKGVLFVGRAFGHGAVQEMKVWPFAAARAEGGCKPPHAALADDRRGERCGKGARDASGGDREDGAQSSFSGIAADVSKPNQVTSKPGCSRSARDESGGRPLTARRCPACRRREPGLLLVHGTWEGVSRHCRSPCGGGREGACQAAEPQGSEYRRGTRWRTGS